MLEAQIKNDYRLGNRKGVTELDDYFYMPIRITGSGLNFRKLGDTVIVADRSKGEFFNEAFIEHCKSLPIIVDHPTDENGEKDMLHTNTLQNNAIVGNTIDAWIDDANDDEIWGLARIYDKTILEKIKSGEIKSTSPGIRIFYKETDPDFKTETPYIINHLAFCEKGHWDKDDGRTAIDTSDFSKIDLTFDSNFDILQKKEQEDYSMVAEKIDNTETKDTEPTEVGVKANDTEEQKVAEKVSAMKANDAEETKADEKEAEKGEEKEKEEKDEAEKDDEKGDKANDAEIGLSKAASLMAKASHAGLENKREEKPVETVKDEGQKPEETKTETEEKEGLKETKPQKTNDSDEAIDSENETEDDKKRDNEIKEMRKVCDSADANLNVKMPFISGRQTYRSVAHKFIQANKQFLDKKYANLALDSYTPELAKEVLESVYANIRKESKIDDKPVKVGGYVRMSDGTLCDPDF